MESNCISVLHMHNRRNYYNDLLMEMEALNEIKGVNFLFWYLKLAKC